MSTRLRKTPPGRVHYEELHRTSQKYQCNNWLLEDLPRLTTAGAESILEVGCGNGLFLEQAVNHWAEVVGVDWVRSAVLDRVLNSHPGIRFVQDDVLELDVGRHFDLIVSADFFEHLGPASVTALIRRLHACGGAGYHKIACYDDGHSHLSVFGPRRWLRLFEEAAPGAGYRIERRSFRKAKRKKPVVVITNLKVRT